ncbi:radical SAM family heme chaperone HemW [Yoonia sp. 2307UL14-13]|uniref:radical SAM family heme chaperone HemW n=1 Tax=Yoonia sp. 2307UL14-13 TaxID=3126506 RepID=UPI0030B79EB6
MTEDWEHGGFGLYIHWPFCQAKCPYCDFNSHVVAQIDQKAWEKAYLSEIARIGEETRGRVLRSVFFGGGTPSLMDPDVVASVLEAVRRTWPIANNLEVTLEANPTSVEAGRFAGYRDAGVNRVSMGIQALNDADLKRLGRLHSVAEAMTAFDVARGIFDRVSFDLIYARQGQSLEDWRSELQQALDFAVDHLSLYQLTIEDGTAFGDLYARGRLRDLPEDDLTADMYLLTQDMCTAAGMAGYEISNHARCGAESVHNMIYWRYGDYAGIGPGAHGRLTLAGQRYAIETPLAPMEWLSQVRRTGRGEGVREALDLATQRSELLLMGLRLFRGVDLSRLELKGDESLFNKISYLTEIDMVSFDHDRLTLTQAGRPILNAILRELLPDH